MASGVWFRRDLRLADHPALAAAVESGEDLVLFYILDEATEPLGAAEKVWLHFSLQNLMERVQGLGGKLVLLKGCALDVVPALCADAKLSRILWNRRYEPSGIECDKLLKEKLQSQNVEAVSYEGNVLVEPWKIATSAKKPFQVYTPFWKALRAVVSLSTLSSAPSSLSQSATPFQGVTLESLALLPHIPWDKEIRSTWKIGEDAASQRLGEFSRLHMKSYDENRNLPAFPYTSRLSPHIHFGEIHVQRIWHQVSDELSRSAGAETFLKEIVWRDFAHHLLFHFPTTVREPLRVKFNAFPWIVDAELLEAWKRGNTGYPIVDAGMRELWATGWMHNRVRMIVASFLVKHLLIDWRVGAEWFRDTLVDADLASNTLGWQWTAGCGADAAPYFRVFNPILQGEKFDASGGYVRRWVPEISGISNRWIHRPWEAPGGELLSAKVALGETYPRPIVDHQESRNRALDAFDMISQKDPDPLEK